MLLLNTGLTVIYVVFNSFEYYLKDHLNAILKTILRVIFYQRHHIEHNRRVLHQTPNTL